MEDINKIIKSYRSRYFNMDDWHQLSALYLIAPLGEKSANDLETVFTNSRFKCFIYDKTLCGNSQN